MQNQDSSPKVPASSGVIGPNWDEFVKTHHRQLPIEDIVLMQTFRYVFYAGCLSTYNLLMMSLRMNPMIAATITAVAKDELDKFFDVKIADDGSAD